MYLLRNCIIFLGVLGITVGCVRAAPPEEAKAERRDAEHMDLYTANLFHRRLALAFSRQGGLGVSYGGPLGHNGKVVVRSPGPITHLTVWNITMIERDLPWETPPPPRICCTISVSQRKHPGSLATCNINRTKLWVWVTYMREGWTVDTKIPGTGDLSIRQLVELAVAQKDVD